jgi:hypothetical protein
LTADRVLAVAVRLAVVATVVQVVTQVIDFGAFDLSIVPFNSDIHLSIFGILSLIAQGAAVAALASRCRLPARRGGWLALGALVLVLLAVRVAHPDDPIVLLAPVAIAFVLFWHLTSGDDPRARAVVRVGLMLLAVSFVIHIGPKLIGSLAYGYGTWPYEIKSLAKHTTELAGWILISAGVVAAELYPSG